MDLETANAGVVADKSWVHSPGAEFRAIGSRYIIFFTDILLYELVTTEPAKRALCFQNLRDVEASLVLLPCLGELLRYEALCQHPCTPVYERRLGRVSINPKTGEPAFRFSNEQIQIIEEAKSEREVDVCKDSGDDGTIGTFRIRFVAGAQGRDAGRRLCSHGTR